MKPENNSEILQYLRARRKTKEIRGFYFNAASYCLVIPILIYINLTYSPEFYWFFFSAIGWGIGLLFHGLGVYDVMPFFNSEWGKRKISKLLEEESLAGNIYEETKNPNAVFAIRRFKKIRRYYYHLALYIVVNLALIGLQYYNLDDGENFWEFNTFAVAFFWGIGIFFDTLNVLLDTFILGSEWEKKQMSDLIGKKHTQKWQ